MSLTKDDLKEITKIVNGSIEKSNMEMKGFIKGSIEQSSQGLKKYVDGSIGSAIEKSKNEIIDVMTREINDLADINQAVIDKIDNHETRIIRVEHNLGLVKV